MIRFLHTLLLVLISYTSYAAETSFERVVLSLVDNALNKDNPDEAKDIIESHLDFGSSAQEEASKRVFYYYFNKNYLGESETVIVTHFKEGSVAYENLAEVMFYHYLRNQNISTAEIILTRYFSKGHVAYENLAERIFCYHLSKNKPNYAELFLQTHYTNGHIASDRLVHLLVDYWIDHQEFDKATQIANRNMNIGSTENTDIKKYIKQKQHACLNSSHVEKIRRIGQRDVLPTLTINRTTLKLIGAGVRSKEFESPKAVMDTYVAALYGSAPEKFVRDDKGTIALESTLEMPVFAIELQLLWDIRPESFVASFDKAITKSLRFPHLDARSDDLLKALNKFKDILRHQDLAKGKKVTFIFFNQPKNPKIICNYEGYKTVEIIAPNSLIFEAFIAIWLGEIDGDDHMTTLRKNLINGFGD